MNGVVGDYIIIGEVMWRMNTHLWRWAGAGNSCELLLVLLVTIFWRFWRSATGPDTGQSACHLPNHDTSMILNKRPCFADSNELVYSLTLYYRGKTDQSSSLTLFLRSCPSHVSRWLNEGREFCFWIEAVNSFCRLCLPTIASKTCVNIFLFEWMCRCIN